MLSTVVTHWRPLRRLRFCTNRVTHIYRTHNFIMLTELFAGTLTNLEEEQKSEKWHRGIWKEKSESDRRLVRWCAIAYLYYIRAGDQTWRETRERKRKREISTFFLYLKIKIKIWTSRYLEVLSTYVVKRERFLVTCKSLQIIMRECQK